MNDKPLLALCPIGKFVFSHEDALRVKRSLQEMLRAREVRFVDLDEVIPDGMIREQAHVEQAVKHFRAAGADALFLPHCNFGTEGAAAMIAKQLALPTLLWGPRDEAPLADGTRLRDSLCGLMATSKVLGKLGVPFSYIENCRIDDPPFAEGLDRFLRAAAVASAFRDGMRIGHIGQRIDFFWTTIVNESELLERFNISVQPIDMVDFITAAKSRVEENSAAYGEEVARLRTEMTVEGFPDDAPLMRVLAVRDQMLSLVEEHNLDGLAVQDFTSLVDAMGAYCFLANSMVSEQVPLACESDIHGAVSAVMLHRAARGAVFLADVTVRHPEDDNGVLLWHAGAPLSMMADGERARLGKHWILPSPLSGMPHFPLRAGAITVARFDGDRGEYRLAVGEGRSMDGPETLNNYVWMGVNDWPRWERQLIEGPFIHHVAMAYAQCGAALLDACRFIPGLEPLRLGDDADRPSSSC